MVNTTYISKSVEETQKIARDLAGKARIIALYGDLGAGKTTFVQGLVKALGITQRIISPTFIIVRTYKLPRSLKSLNFYHIDLYRIENQKDIQGLGIPEILSDPLNIVVIEWAEKLGALLPKNAVKVYLEYVNENTRKIRMNYG